MGCEVLKWEVKIQKVRVERKLSYAEAAKQVRGQVLGQKIHPWGPMREFSEVSKANLMGRSSSIL